MEKTVEKLRGYVHVSVIGASAKDFLNACSERGVVITECRAINETELICTIPRRYSRTAEYCAGISGCELRILSQRGASYTFGRVKRRYLLLSGLLVTLMLLGFSGFFIWDMDIVGNDTIPDWEIRSALEECGVYIGANWTEFNADMIRSEMLEKIPKLSFLTVNVKGSRAEVIVRERIEAPEMQNDVSHSHIIAAKDGVISKMSVFRGQGMVSAGDEVRAGDVLISGTVSGIELWEQPVEYNYVSALGEVYAETAYEFTAAESLVKQEKHYTGRVARSFALLLGENRLNFYKNTGIYRNSCDTIYYVWKLELPGIFTLPVALVQECRAQYELLPVSEMQSQVVERLKGELLSRLERETGESAQFLSEEFTVRQYGDMVYVTLSARCLEDIGLKQPADVYPREEEEYT